MRFARVRTHYGSIVLGYSLACALPVIAAVCRRLFGPGTDSFPFVLFYPVIVAVSFFRGAAPGIAAIVFSAVSVPLVLPAFQPSALNWLVLAAFGAACVAFGSALRYLRESAADSARAMLRFRVVTDYVSDWIFFLDSGGKVEYANRAACAGLGRSEAEIVGRPLGDLIAAERREQFAELIRSTLAGPVTGEEWLVEQTGGELIPVELSCTAIPANHDTVIHVAGRDLRERRDTERRLREGRQWEALGTLAGGIAHDFNNLLTAMMGNASLAREMLPPAHETAGLLDNVLSAGARSANLIELMLAAAGYRRNFSTSVDPGPLLASAIAKVSIPGNVAVRTQVGPGVFSGEYASLERLLTCLLENAVESYGPEGGEVLAEIGVAESSFAGPGDFDEGECEGECLYIVVEDHGGGMDQDTLERAFNPFFTTKFTGRGLGLAAVRGLVRAYSGRLRIQTRPGQGTRVRVWLPGPTV